MRCILWPVTVLLAVGFYPRACPAQGSNGFTMPSSKVLSMSVDKFVALYLRKTGDPSEAGQDAAFDYYYQRELARDKVRERELTHAQRNKVDQLRNALGEYEDKFITLKMITAEGGTMYSHTSERVPALQEEQVARIIVLVQRPVRHTAARRRVRAADVRIRRAVIKLRRNPDPDAKQRSEFGRQYAPAYDSFQRSANTLLNNLNGLSDDAAAVAAKYAVSVLRDF